jgi:2,3-bisphosphoglycerate-dependent phosphoglycerate mutase
VATGWLPGRLSRRGHAAAAALGERRREDGITVVLTSDLRRAVETADIAMLGTGIPVLHDWRLRECDYGELNGAPTAVVHGDRRRYLYEPYPGGESWRQAVTRASGVLADLASRWSGARVLIVGHVATRLALDEVLLGRPLEETLTTDFAWQPGWEYLS